MVELRSTKITFIIFASTFQLFLGALVMRAGLPDGFFSDQKSKFGQILDGLRCGNVDIFYGYLGYFTTLWYILCSFGTFFPVLVSCTEKIWQPCMRGLLYLLLSSNIFFSFGDGTLCE
jgi:hypothetical protein